MATMKAKELRNQYHFICEQYIRKFIKKQGYALSEIISEYKIIVFIDQYYFSMTDIIHDINSKIPKGAIFKWQDDCIEGYKNNGKIEMITYESYCLINSYKL